MKNYSFKFKFLNSSLNFSELRNWEELGGRMDDSGGGGGKDDLFPRGAISGMMPVIPIGGLIILVEEIGLIILFNVIGLTILFNVIELTLLLSNSGPLPLYLDLLFLEEIGGSINPWVCGFSLSLFKLYQSSAFNCIPFTLV